MMLNEIEYENEPQFPYMYRDTLYPFGEISANPNIIQREDNNTLVFWDAGAQNPAN